MATYPEDRFDNIPEDLERVGAHRAPKKKGGGWVGFAWAALATGVLVVGGLYGLSKLNDGISFELPGFPGAAATSTPTPTSTPTMEPITDPTTIDPARAISITILNGTPVVGLEGAAETILTGQGWPVGSTTVAAADDVELTFIYFSDPLNEDVARGVAIALGTGEVRQSDAYLGAPITVVLGADFQEKQAATP